MLTDDDGSIDADNFPVGECLANHSHRLGVAVGLIVSRHYHSSVHNEEVGIGSGKALSIEIYRLWRW